MNLGLSEKDVALAKFIGNQMMSDGLDEAAKSSGLVWTNQADSGI